MLSPAKVPQRRKNTFRVPAQQNKGSLMGRVVMPLGVLFVLAGLAALYARVGLSLAHGPQQHLNVEVAVDAAVRWGWCAKGGGSAAGAFGDLAVLRGWLSTSACSLARCFALNACRRRECVALLHRRCPLGYPRL